MENADIKKQLMKSLIEAMDGSLNSDLKEGLTAKKGEKCPECGMTPCECEVEGPEEEAGEEGAPVGIKKITVTKVGSGDAEDLKKKLAELFGE